MEEGTLESTGQHTRKFVLLADLFGARQHQQLGVPPPRASLACRVDDIIVYIREAGLQIPGPAMCMQQPERVRKWDIMPLLGFYVVVGCMRRSECSADKGVEPKKDGILVAALQCLVLIA